MFPALTGDVTTTAGALATTVGSIGGKAVSLGAALTTTGAGAPTLAFPAAPYTFTFPAASGTLAELGLAQTWALGQTFSATATFADSGTWTSSGIVNNSPIKFATYTIGALPACSAGLLGSAAVVSNGTAYGTGTYGSAVSATGIVTRSVLCTNTAGATTYAWAYN